MADRVTKVTLTANVSQYIAGMEQAARSTSQTANEAQKLAAKGEAIQTVGRAALAVGALAAVGVGLAVAKFAEFDQQMSAVQAATHESASAMAVLRDVALDAGAETVFSATEAAQAIEELAKAGLTTSEIIGGALDGALSLAAASGIGVAEAAEIAAKTLNQFNLEGAQTEHVADLLAAGAGKASGEVTDLGAALAQVGQVANGAGLTIEETTTALAAFASQGLLGSDAGTSFKTMLGALTPNSAKAADEMERLGISAFDAGGNFIGLEAFAGNLRQGLAKMSDQQRSASLEIMFGSDAVRAATSLYNEGATGIAEWSEKVNDSGFAAETAALRMDNLAGDIEKFGGAVDTALIKTGSAANTALRGMVQSVTGMVDAFGEAPQGVQTTALALGALTAAVGLAGGAALLAVPKIVAFKVALETLGVSAATTNKTMGLLKTSMVALAAVGVFAWAAQATGGFISSAREAAGLKDTVDSLAESFDNLGAKATVDKVVGDRLGASTDAGFFSDILTSAEKNVAGLEDFSLMLQALGVEGQLTSSKLATLDKTMADMASSGDVAGASALYEELASRTNGSAEAMDKLNALLPEYMSAQEDAGGATAEATEQVDSFASATETAGQSVDDFVAALQGLGDTQLNLNEANRAVQESLDSFTATVEENGQTLDITTEAGRENQAALDGIAQSYKNAAAATVEQTGKQEDAIPVIQAGRDAIIAAGKAAGLSAEDAAAYADELGLIPSDVQTQIDANWAEAISNANAVARAIRDIPGYRAVIIDQVVQQTGAARGAVGAAYNANGGMYAYANGGFGSGFYSGRKGALYKFAEPEVGWEAFISGKPGMEERNRGIALEAYQKLGGQMPAAGGPMSVSLAGARISLDVGGQEIVGVIRAQAVSAVSSYDKAASRTQTHGTRL